MHKRMLALALASVLAVADLSLGGNSTATAASHFAFRLNKTVLADRSIDGPALASSETGTPALIRSVLAWTGTDPGHHLNVMTSTDGIHYGDKRILNETSFARPAVTLFAEGVVVLAWTGNDANHSLNILYDVYGAHPQKLTLRNENSFTAPALGAVVFGVSIGKQPLLLLGWTGTDANHSLNLRLFEFQGGLQPVNKTIAPAAFNSVAGPTFTLDPTTRDEPGDVMTWAARTPLHRLAYARLTWNGTRWNGLTAPTFIQEWSAASSGFLFLHSLTAIWAWTGIDPAHTLNFIDGVFSAEPQKATLGGETALGGPALGGVGQANQFILTWTGTDAAHHLNVATITF